MAIRLERREVRRQVWPRLRRPDGGVRSTRDRAWDDLPWASHPVTLVYPQRRVVRGPVSGFHSPRRANHAVIEHQTNRRLLPGVQEREKLNRLLRVHDPDTGSAGETEISAKYAPMLRQIASGGSHTGGDPGVRRRAIAWLGRFAAPEDMNTLVALAQYDPDPNVRGAAVLGLGASGAQLAARGDDDVQVDTGAGVPLKHRLIAGLVCDISEGLRSATLGHSVPECCRRV